MTVSSAIESYYTTSSTTTKSSKDSTAFGSDDFMELLLAQLSNQNPLEPMDDSEMMSQFTQLNSLSAMQDIQSDVQEVLQDSQMSYATGLLGKIVTIGSSNDTAIEGKVTGFSLFGDAVRVEIDEKNYALEDVISVSEEVIDE